MQERFALSLVMKTCRDMKKSLYPCLIIANVNFVQKLTTTKVLKHPLFKILYFLSKSIKPIACQSRKSEKLKKVIRRIVSTRFVIIQNISNALKA